MRDKAKAEQKKKRDVQATVATRGSRDIIIPKERSNVGVSYTIRALVLSVLGPSSVYSTPLGPSPLARVSSARCDDAKLKAQQGAKPTKSSEGGGGKNAGNSTVGLEMAIVDSRKARGTWRSKIVNRILVEVLHCCGLEAVKICNLSLGLGDGEQTQKREDLE